MMTMSGTRAEELGTPVLPEVGQGGAVVVAVPVNMRLEALGPPGAARLPPPTVLAFRRRGRG